jgi:hypothetical protein
LTFSGARSALLSQKQQHFASQFSECASEPTVSVVSATPFAPTSVL